MRHAALPVLGTGTRAAELERQGWTRRFAAASPRLEEMTELYVALGLEVRHEPITANELDGDCAACCDAGPPLLMIYTREAP